MKNLRFALWAIALLCLLGSCSIGDIEINDPAETEKEAESEPVDNTPDGNEPDDDNDSENGTLDKDKPAEDGELPDNGNEPPVDGEEPPDEDNELPVIDLPPLHKDSDAPVLQINELRTEYSGPQLTTEFIEFRANAQVNLGGMRVYIVSNTSNPLVYTFLPVEVKENEYVVLHLRTLEEACVDEYGDDLNESGGKFASPTARDFWVPGNTKLLRKTDIVYVLDKDDKVVDAVMLAEDTKGEWPRAHFAEAAEFLYNNDAWKSTGGEVPRPADAVNSSDIGAALTRSISRDETVEHTRTVADWYITANSGATPGRQNNPRRFVRN